MSAPTYVKPPTFNQFLKDRNLERTQENLDKIGTLLGKKGSKTSQVPVEKIGEVEELFTAPPEPEEPAVAPRQPDASTPGTSLGSPLRVTDTVLRTRRDRPSQNDFDIVKEISPFVEAYRAVELPFVPEEIWRAGTFFAYKSPVTERQIKLTLEQYTSCKDAGNFPIITQEDLRNFQFKLGELWCVKHQCDQCGEAIDPLLQSKASVILKGRFNLPFVGDPQMRIRFRAAHDECRISVHKLIDLELELREWSGTEDEEVEYRKKVYRDIMVEALPAARVHRPNTQQEDIYRRMYKILQRSGVEV